MLAARRERFASGMDESRHSSRPMAPPLSPPDRKAATIADGKGDAPSVDMPLRLKPMLLDGRTSGGFRDRDVELKSKLHLTVTQASMTRCTSLQRVSVDEGNRVVWCY